MPKRNEVAWGPLEDMQAVNLNDHRLDVRALGAVSRALAAPGDSFPNMMYDDAELEGFYRLMNNSAVSLRALLTPHYAATARRVTATARPVIVAHDTTAFSFGGEGERKGVGTIANHGTGFAAHAALALTFDGLPLGVLDVQTHTRFGKATTPSWKRDPAHRESARWSRGVEGAMAHLGEQQDVVHVMDREADAYLLIDALLARKRSFVIRLSQGKRKIVDENYAELSDAIEVIAAVTTRDAWISARSDYKRQHGAKATHPARQGREVHLAIGARQITFKAGSDRKHATQPTRDVNVVRVWEPKPVAGEPAVEWLLITNLPIATTAQLEHIVDCYRRRWCIEEFFKALKTGCAYEERQFESRHALENALALFVPIAAHLLLLRSLARATPDVPAATSLSCLQLQVLRAISRRFKLNEAPTVREALFAIAGLGGFLKRNGEPGWQTLGRGHERLLEAIIVWKAAKGLA